MNEPLGSAQRRALVALAAAILPGSETQPSAADIQIEQAPIDRALASRPDLVPALRRILDGSTDDPERYLHALDDADFGLLMTMICSAWSMDGRVRKALGYQGQEALTPNRGGFGAEELVLEMMEQPKRYRDV